MYHHSLSVIIRVLTKRNEVGVCKLFDELVLESSAPSLLAVSVRTITATVSD